MLITSRAHILIVLLSCGLLFGCSTVRMVDSQVAAFSKIDALPAAASWRFERLPSQQNLTDSQATRQLKLEALATEQLAKIGFKPLPEREGAAAQYSVQVSSRIQRLDRGPFDESFGVWGGFGHGLIGRDYHVSATGRLIYVPIFPPSQPPWYVREVGLILRDTADHRVVYETKAQHEGRWADDEAVLPAMFAAALQGFPKPAEGKRMVNIEIPK
jgi:hypothetical protein